MTATTDLSKPVQKLVAFLGEESCSDLDDAELIAELGMRLTRLGLGVDRLTLHLPTLHPRIFRRVVAWAPGEPVEIRDRGSGAGKIEAFHAGPVAKAIAAGEPIEIEIDRTAPPPWLDCVVFRKRGLCAFVLVPLRSTAGPVSVIGFATKHGLGFCDTACTVIEGIAPALARLMERRMMRRDAA